MKAADDLARAAQFLIPSDALVFPVKINIHFDVEGELLRECIRLNNAIDKEVKTEISFSPPSIQKPHLTLAMGYCDSELAYGNILSSVNQFTSRRMPILVSMGRLYVKEPDAQYVFWDVQPQELLRNWKKELYDFLGGSLAPLDWDVVAEPPHITLAYFKQRSPACLNNIRRPKTSDLKVLLDRISIAYSGPRGTCLGAIRSFQLV